MVFAYRTLYSTSMVYGICYVKCYIIHKAHLHHSDVFIKRMIFSVKHLQYLTYISMHFAFLAYLECYNFPYITMSDMVLEDVTELYVLVAFLHYL